MFRLYPILGFLDILFCGQIVDVRGKRFVRNFKNIVVICPVKNFKILAGNVKRGSLQLIHSSKIKRGPPGCAASLYEPL